MAAKKAVKKRFVKEAPIETAEEVFVPVPTLDNPDVISIDPTCVHCTEPLAPGQNYVCKNHIRRG